MNEERPRLFTASPEGYAFFVGVGMALGLVAYSIWPIFTAEPFNLTTNRLWAVIAADFAGGRAAGAFAGVNQGVDRGLLTLLITYYNATFLLLLYPPQVFFYAKLLRSRFLGLGEALQSAHRHARHTSYLRHSGLIGVFLFVYIPMPLTGSIMGALVGALLGYRLSRLLPVVLLALTTSAVSLVYAIDSLHEYIQQNINKTAATILVVSLIAAIIAWRLWSLRRERRRRRSGEPETALPERIGEGREEQEEQEERQEDQGTKGK